MAKIWMPIVSLLLAALILLGAYNGLLGIRERNAEKELQAKMETLLPGSTTFTEEAYTGEDDIIAALCEQYEVEVDVAREDFRLITEQLKALKLIDDEQ